MSWKKYFTVAPNVYGMPQDTKSTGTTSNYSSFLPEVYAGHPNRIQRYYQYDDMDRDSDICAALDTIADFSTQSEEQQDQPLEIKYNEEATETEVLLLKRYLEQWMRLNNFRSKLWYIFRDTIKNGDAFFLRDPETQEWLWLDHYTVEMVKVESDGTKSPSEYLVRGFDYNQEAKFAAQRADMNQYKSPFGLANANGTRPMTAASVSSSMSLAGGMRDPRMLRMMNGNNELFVVDANHVIHLSLSVGNDINWPFGQSVLEPIFKTFKQKELLEDSIIIYRVQRAPERRVFYIDVGQMPPAKARQHLDQIKNEIHQRRIPNHSGGGSSMLDAAYNPLAICEDYFFAQCLSLNTEILLLDGRSLPLSEIISEYENGITNWAYSINLTTHEMEPGKISWAGVTRKNAQVLRVTLDNGETIDATPDHRFILRDGSEIEAQNLASGMSLMPLYLDYATTGPSNNHKVVSVELLPYREDTGDITVESASDSHVFAVAAGVYVHNSAEGRGSKVETLPGGENLGEITDLSFFTKKMARGLRIPESYLSLGDDSGNVAYNDGKLGAAMIQEYRFNKYCMRLQALLAPKFDKEFKHFLKEDGVEIDHSIFQIAFCPPQNFTKYRQIEIDQAQVGVYQMVADNKKLSERFKFKRFLNLTEDELLENERMWSEENAAKLKKATGQSPAESTMDSDLSSVGIRAGGFDGGMDMPMDDIGGDIPMDAPPEAAAPDAGAGALDAPAG